MQIDICIKIRSLEKRRRNYIIPKEDFVKKKKWQKKYREKLIAPNFLNLIHFDPIINLSTIINYTKIVNYKNKILNIRKK